MTSQSDLRRKPEVADFGPGASVCPGKPRHMGDRANSRQHCAGGPHEAWTDLEDPMRETDFHVLVATLDTYNFFIDSLTTSSSSSPRVISSLFPFSFEHSTGCDFGHLQF
jgi:hypothetical protein